MVSIENIPVGSKVKVIGYERGRVRSHLLAMGLTPGVCFELLDRAPLGDPVVLRVRDFCLSVRSKDARALQLDWA